MKIKPTVSVIVPAYNEERGIAKVLAPLSSSKIIKETICVNDGSTDQTGQIIRQFQRVRLVDLKKNQGKGNALAEGVKRAAGEIIVFVDADIDGLNDKVLQKIINPLLKHTHQLVIAYTKTFWADPLFKPITGQRAYYRKDLLPVLSKLRGKGYGSELYLNYLFRDKKIKIIGLGNLEQNHSKYQKQPFDVATKLFIKEVNDILAEILKQENPTKYLAHSYLTPFYFPKKPKSVAYVKKIAEKLKRKINALLIS